MQRRSRSQAAAFILVAGTLLATALPTAASGAVDRSRLEIVESATPGVIAYKDTGTWSFTVENTGTTKTATPVILDLLYNGGSNDDHPHPRLAQAWAKPTVSSPTTKQCGLHTAGKRKSASCTVPALRPGQRASIVVTARAEASPRETVGVGWAFTPRRGAGDKQAKSLTSGVTQSPLLGKYETAAAEAGGIHVSGWAGNPISPSTPFNVRAYMDGKRIGAVETAVARPEVAEANAVGADSGFDAVFPTTGPGKRTLCLVANGIGYGTGEVDLGCKTREFAATTPDGAVDEVSSDAPNSLTLRGWATDGDAPDAAVQVVVTARDTYDIAPTTVATFPAGQTRPEDAARGAHGFDLRISDPTLYQADEVCLVARNVGVGSDRLLGCSPVHIAFG